jgi:hypothetical protein
MLFAFVASPLFPRPLPSNEDGVTSTCAICTEKRRPAERSSARRSCTAGTKHARSNGKTSPAPAQSAQRSVAHTGEQTQGRRPHRHNTHAELPGWEQQRQDVAGTCAICAKKKRRPAERSSARRSCTAGTKHARSNGKTSPAPARSAQRSVAHTGEQTQGHRAHRHNTHAELPGWEQQRQDVASTCVICAGSARRSVAPPSDQAQGDRAQRARSTRGAAARRHWLLRGLCREASLCRATKRKEIAHSEHKAAAHVEQQQDFAACAICVKCGSPGTRTRKLGRVYPYPFATRACNSRVTGKGRCGYGYGSARGYPRVTRATP